MKHTKWERSCVIRLCLKLTVRLNSVMSIKWICWPIREDVLFNLHQTVFHWSQSFKPLNSSPLALLIVYWACHHSLLLTSVWSAADEWNGWLGLRNGDALVCGCRMKPLCLGFLALYCVCVFATPHSLWDLSFLTREWTWALVSESAES